MNEKWEQKQGKKLFEVLVAAFNCLTALMWIFFTTFPRKSCI